MISDLFSRRRRILFAIGSLLMVLSISVTACGQAGGTPTAAGDGDEPTATQTEQGPAETPDGQSGGGGSLSVAFEQIVQTDPALISSDSEVAVANAVYDYLVDVDADNQIQPRLAIDWETSEDGLTYTFTLADGVVFHDGTAFSAQDVVYTFNRLRDPESGFATVDLYSNITAVEATGDLEVTFTLESPNPFFLFDLSDNHALIIQQDKQDATDFVGTGPFRVVDYSPEDRIQFEANPDYFVEGQPLLDELDFIFFGDRSAAVDALRGGQVDLVMSLSTPNYQGLEDRPGIERLLVSTNAFPVIRLRADQPPGNDPRVMQAMRHAIDREAIFELVQQRMGAPGRDTPVGPLYRDLYTEEIPLPEHDPERARDLLQEAGYGDGLDLTLRLPEAQNFPDLAVVLKEQLANVGINVEVSVEPEGVYYGEDGWLEAAFGITGWGSRPYPQFYLDVMLVCGARWNESHFCDDEFDRWASIAGTTTDPFEQQEAYFEIQRILIERGPIIVPFFFPQLGAMSEGVDGFEMKAFPGRSDFRPVSVAR